LPDGIAAIAQDPRLAVDECDGALAGARIAVAGIDRDRAALRAELTDVDADLALRSHHHRQLVLLAVQDELGGAGRSRDGGRLLDEILGLLRHSLYPRLTGFYPPAARAARNRAVVQPASSPAGTSLARAASIAAVS